MNEGTRQKIAGGLHQDVPKMEDLLDAMAMKTDGNAVRPKAITLSMLREYAPGFVETDNNRGAEKDFYSMMADGRYPKNELAYRLRDCGYTPALHPKAERVQWKGKGKRTTI